MKQFLFSLICVIFFANISKAQSFKCNPDGTYDVRDAADASPWLGVPATGDKTKSGSGTPPSLTCFIEFGDGTFSFEPSGKHTFVTSLSNKDICTKFTGVYAGGGKPPNHAMAAKVPPTSSVYTEMGILGGTDKVLITPNIGSVLEKDTMIFVVTYKLAPNQINGNLLFLFNDNKSNTIFNVYSKGAKFNDENTFYKDVDFVRPYFGENEIISFTNAAANTQRTKNSIYQNYIAFDKLKSDNEEHNIFITLIPSTGISTEKFSKTFVKAILAFDNKVENSTDSKPVVSETFNELQVVDKSHDPNYITVDPVCMLLPKANHKIDYHLHFQNTGTGGASRVRVAIKTPEGVSIANDITYTHSPDWYKIINGTINNTAPYSNATGDSLIFDFVKNTSMTSATATLDGMSLTPSAANTNKTTGDVWFTINSTNAMPSILLAQASIVFFNASDGSVNEPIITNTAVTQFRECCECEQKCDKCKNKGRLWRWLFCKKC